MCDWYSETKWEAKKWKHKGSQTPSSFYVWKFTGKVIDIIF
jgi:hypothetical protein